MKTFLSRLQWKGFSLVEVIVAVGLFMLLIPNIIALILSNHTAVYREQNRIEATSLVEQATEAIKSIKDYDWEDLPEGEYILSDTNGYWELVPGTSEVINDDFTRTILIVDTKTYAKSIQVQVAWQNLTQQTNTVTANTQLTNWKRFIWAQSTAREFSYGKENSVKISSLEDGEVQLIDKGGLPELVTFDNPVFEDMEEIAELFIDRNENLLYVGTNQSATGAEFLIFDISNVSNKDIILKKNFEVGFDVHDIAIEDGYAYLAVGDSDGEVQIVDMSDMTLVETIDIPGTARVNTLVVTNNDLFVGTDDEMDGYWADPPDNTVWVEYEELWEYDVSNPASPSLVDDQEVNGDINDMEVYNSSLITATSKNGAEFEIRNFSLSRTGYIALPGNEDATSVHVYGDMALVGRVGGSYPEIYNIDISNVSSPTYDNEESISLSGNPTVSDIFVGDSWIYVSLHNSTVDIFTVGKDLSDPETLAAQLYIDLGDITINTLSHLGAYVYTGTDEANSLRILTGPISTWSDLDILDTIDLSGNEDPKDIFVDDEYLYVLRNNYLYIINRYEYSSGGSDFLVGSFYFSSTINDFSIDESGDYAYLATTDNSKEFVIVDISDPESPFELRSYNISGSSDGTHIDSGDGRVYLSTRTQVVTWGWSWFWNWFWNWICTYICVSESCAWWFWGWCLGGWICNEYEEDVCNRESLGSASLYVFDVSAPQDSTSMLGSLYLDEMAIETMVLGGEHVFIGTIGEESNENIVIIRISNPDNLQIVNQEDIPGAGIFSIFYRDQKIYTSAADEGSEVEDEESNADFAIWDVFDATNLYEIGKLNVGTFNTVFIQDNFAYLSSEDESRELMILDITNLSNPQLLGTFSYSGFNVKGIFIKDEYIYFLTDNNSQEILVVGQADEEELAQSQWGIFTSSTLDTKSGATDYEFITWNQDGDGIIECQLRTADTEENLDTALWFGLNGVVDAYFSSEDPITEYGSATGTRWVQYRCVFRGDGTQIPILKDMSIEYEK